MLCWSDLSRRHRERQRREFTLFCETRHSSVPYSLEKHTAQCTATNLHWIGKKKMEVTLPKCPKISVGWHGHTLQYWQSGAHPPSHRGLFDVMGERAEDRRRERSNSCKLSSALLLCSHSCGEQEGWAIAGGMQRAGQSSSTECCHSETCPPPAFVSSPLPHFHGQDNAKSCCAYAHWG